MSAATLGAWTRTAGWLALLCGLALASVARAQPSACGPGGREGLIPEDTLLHVTNRGVTRIFANVNGQRFKLVTDPAEVDQSANAFPIPAESSISINIAALMLPADNCYAFRLQGPPDSEADFFIANVPLAGQPIAYAIDDLEALPARLDLLESAPNPFRTRTMLTYTIPEDRTNGLDVELAVYDARGRRIRVLVDGRRFPGTFTVAWDGTSQRGTPVAAGVYFCRLLAGDMHQTIGVVHVK